MENSFVFVIITNVVLPEAVHDYYYDVKSLFIVDSGGNVKGFSAVGWSLLLALR